MSVDELRLANAPIIEAVLDIDCEPPPGQELAALEGAARDGFRHEYPKFKPRYFQEHQIRAQAEGPPDIAVDRGVEAFLFLHDDEKQLVQVRRQGFSFNRLAPYTSLDEYLPEIKRAWQAYVSLATPVQARLIRLRYINRFELPASDRHVTLADFLKLGPRPPKDMGLDFHAFLEQQRAVEPGTSNEVSIVVASQPHDGDVFPVILDITAFRGINAEPEDWPAILSVIESLRELKNRVFRYSLTERCLHLFQK